MKRRFGLAEGLVAGVVVVLGLLGVWLMRPNGSEGEVRADTPGTPVAARRPAVPAYEIPKEQLSSWLLAAADNERPLIEDGVLTFDEYESAVMTTVRCMEAAGITVVHSKGYGRADGIEPGTRLSSRGVYSYFGQITTYSSERPTGAFAEIDRCKAFSTQIEFLWAQHTALSETEIQPMRSYMAACLGDVATSLGPSPTDAQLRSLRTSGRVDDGAYTRCQFESADRYEIDKLPG